MELSVAEVSGLIAAVQLLLPAIFPAALIGHVGQENSVVTWSVLGRALQSSLWPTILQTDTAAHHGELRRVSNGLLLQTAIVLLISVAAIATSLGLYQAVEPDDSQELEAFQYVKDESPFTSGTPARLADSFGELAWYLKSGYRQIGMFVLNPTLQVVDGLVVDAKNGGVGFRNHTVAVLVHEYGSSWTEDLLFVDPETQCVDLNFTFDYHLSQIDTSRLPPRDVLLTDHGGFSAL
ncbi:hypothetical protein N658DRAFT_508848 [Parathielavia hyrcaniae]|uniref:Uncharacterized protein n=1 Tax=Parathielavia hyrcaniae TaxID=113614 RepID=A0AAN6PYW8_9PEZI|nr:hypothetical protein N658DRAFT_508848 [Parathielavia hyrcaniae]